MKNLTGSIFTYIALIGVFAFGLTYLLKPSFMPYQAEAVEMSWEEVPTNFQYLIRTYMIAASGGWLALGLVFFFLQNKFNKNREDWIPYLILVSGLIFGIISIYAALNLKMNTPANAPVMPIAGILGTLIVGFFFNIRYGKITIPS